MITSEQVEQFMANHRLKPGDLAARAGVSRGHIYEVLYGRRKVSAVLERALWWVEHSMREGSENPAPAVFEVARSAPTEI